MGKTRVVKLASLKDLPLENIAAKIATAKLKETGSYTCTINGEKTLFLLSSKEDF